MTALYVLVFASAFAASENLGFSRSVSPGLIVHYVGLYGSGARSRLEDWKDFVRRIAAPPGQASNRSGDTELLSRVNRFFNRLPASTDLALWRVEDYWATPSEFQSIRGGDCEDYVIAKYFTLKELGIPASRLRLVYAKVWGSQTNAHMVLAYYPDPHADPLILDNLAGSIELASDRPDLTPVYSFNDDDLQLPQKDAYEFRMSAFSRRWQELMEKLERELAY